MKELVNIFKNNLLLKVISLNGFSVLLRACIGVVTSKMVAVYIGPQGMAFLGNFRNFMSSVQTLGVLGTSNGVIKYVAEVKTDKKAQSKLYATIFFIGSAIALLLGCVLYFGASHWNTYVFGDERDFQLIFKFLGLLLPFYVMQAFLLSIINGLSRYKTFIKINIIGNSLYFVFVIYLVTKFRLVGALYSIIIMPVLLLLVTLFLLWREKFVFVLPKFRNVSYRYIKNLTAFAIMSLFSGLVLPQIMILIRKHIIITIGQSEAGIWEGLQQLSGQYLLFVTSLFTLFLLPKLSENKSDVGFRNEVLNFYKNILPILAVGMLFIYALRKYIILFLFSEDFMKMEHLFLYQLIGDFFKIMSMTIAYQLVAKKMLWKYLFTEVVSLSIIYVTSVSFITILGFDGVVKAYALSYFVYLLMLVFMFRKALLFTK